jgi:hypothetical protein
MLLQPCEATAVAVAAAVIRHAVTDHAAAAGAAGIAADVAAACIGRTQAQAPYPVAPTSPVNQRMRCLEAGDTRRQYLLLVLLLLLLLTHSTR